MLTNFRNALCTAIYSEYSTDGNPLTPPATLCSLVPPTLLFTEGPSITRQTQALPHPEVCIISFLTRGLF